MRRLVDDDDDDDDDDGHGLSSARSTEAPASCWTFSRRHLSISLRACRALHSEQPVTTSVDDTASSVCQMGRPTMSHERVQLLVANFKGRNNAQRMAITATVAPESSNSTLVKGCGVPGGSIAESKR